MSCDMTSRHGVGAHSYANDTQLYVQSSSDNCEAMFARLTSCIDEVGHWMSSIRLKLNTGKMQQLMFADQTYHQTLFPLSEAATFNQKNIDD